MWLSRIAKEKLKKLAYMILLFNYPLYLIFVVSIILPTLLIIYGWKEFTEFIIKHKYSYPFYYVERDYWYKKEIK